MLAPLGPFDTRNHGHHHIYPDSTHYDNRLKITLASTSHHSWFHLYKTPLVDHTCGNIMLRTTIRNAKWSSTIRTTIRILNTWFPTSHATTRDCQWSGANQYKLQFICSHRISNVTRPQPGIATCLTSISCHNSWMVLKKFHIHRYHPKSCNPCKTFPIQPCPYAIAWRSLSATRWWVATSRLADTTRC